MREVHIDVGEVVLDGVVVSDPDGFRAELSRALTALAEGHGGGDYPSGQASVLTGAAVPEVTAAHVAHSVWHSIVAAQG